MKTEATRSLVMRNLRRRLCSEGKFEDFSHSKLHLKKSHFDFNSYIFQVELHIDENVIYQEFSNQLEAPFFQFQCTYIVAFSFIGTQLLRQPQIVKNDEFLTKTPSGKTVLQTHLFISALKYCLGEE